MANILPTLTWLSALIVFAEALNKMERTAPLQPGLTARARLLDALKALAWLLLALGAAGALAAPLVIFPELDGFTFDRFLHPAKSLANTCLLLGFAVLIVRTRIKEG